MIAVLPFFHIYGLCVIMNLGLFAGATLITMPRFEFEQFLDLLERHRVTRAYVAPPIALALAKHPAVDGRDLSALRHILCAAAPLGADLAEEVEQRIGCPVSQGYGMTETSLGALVGDPEVAVGEDPQTPAARTRASALTPPRPATPQRHCRDDGARRPWWRVRASPTGPGLGGARTRHVSRPHKWIVRPAIASALAWRSCRTVDGGGSQAAEPGVAARVSGSVDDWRMSASAPEMVAVLMTDLVGSTAMADRVGPEAAEELRQEHFGLLRGVLERTGGREVKNLGDGLMVVFDGAAQSLACAVGMQQAVEARTRRSEERLGVRIGVSVGDATVEDGDYIGEPVVESARLCAHATGGQIVVNALVRRLASSRDGHRFRSLGGLELKDISEPVAAFELEWEPAAGGRIALPERLRELPAATWRAWCPPSANASPSCPPRARATRRPSVTCCMRRRRGCWRGRAGRSRCC